MLRWLYIQLIWLHPAPFRRRFGDEMLDDFDRALRKYKGGDKVNVVVKREKKELTLSVTLDPPK